MLNAIFV